MLSQATGVFRNRYLPTTDSENLATDPLSTPQNAGVKASKS
jgi:hypothetical protein